MCGKLLTWQFKLNFARNMLKPAYSHYMCTYITYTRPMILSHYASPVLSSSMRCSSSLYHHFVMMQKEVYGFHELRTAFNNNHNIYLPEWQVTRNSNCPSKLAPSAIVGQKGRRDETTWVVSRGAPERFRKWCKCNSRSSGRWVERSRDRDAKRVEEVGKCDRTYTICITSLEYNTILHNITLRYRNYPAASPFWTFGVFVADPSKPIKCYCCCWWWFRRWQEAKKEAENKRWLIKTYSYHDS